MHRSRLPANEARHSAPMATLRHSFVSHRRPPPPSPTPPLRSRPFTSLRRSNPRRRPLLLASPPATAAGTSSSFNLSPPPIDHDDEIMMASATNAIDHSGHEVPQHDDHAIEAALNGTAVMDLSHFGRIRVTGEDRIQFLHNQTTANFESLSDGEGCDATFVTPTARTIDIAHAWIMKQAIVLLVSPTTCRSITEMLNKYIFYADKVEVNDITEQTSFYVLLGPKSSQVMKTLKLDDLIGQPYGTHRHYNVNGTPVTIGVGSVLSKDGFSFLLSPSSAESIWKTLTNLGATPMGRNAWERLRVLQGRPASGKELTKDFNVLEAGLRMAVSLDKGCYKGQETIARLITYNGVKQRLWGIRLSGPAEPGSPITVDGKKVGVLTSYSLGRNDDENNGLGYVKRQVSPGAEVFIGDVVGTVINVPFLCHSL